MALAWISLCKLAFQNIIAHPVNRVEVVVTAQVRVNNIRQRFV